MTTKTMMLAAAVCAVSAAKALVYGDAPDAKHAWAVHDMNRPNPVKVESGAEWGKPPSDAVVLFDGTEESFRRNWTHKNPQHKASWICKDGAIVSVKGAGMLATKQEFGDCQLHIEWMSPPPSECANKGQGEGNSGVFLMGMHEIQVLDSYNTDPAKDPIPNPTYADGQAGAVYAENPPLVNPARKSGVWQTYDIVFHQPIWDGVKMIHPGSITLFFNGVLVQDGWELEGLTTHRRRRPLVPYAVKLPLELQDHGDPVRFRNIWIREIPSRFANKTHGGPAADENAVLAQRQATAAKLYAKIAKPVPATIEGMEAMAEVIQYCREGEYLATWQKVANEFHGVLDKMSDAELKAKKADLLHLRNTLDTLIKAGQVRQECGTRKRISAVALRLGWEK